MNSLPSGAHPWVELNETVFPLVENVPSVKSPVFRKEFPSITKS